MIRSLLCVSAMLLAACSLAVQGPESEVSNEASVEYKPISACCQVTVNDTPDPMYQNGLYSCVDASIPWVCQPKAGGVVGCNDTSCLFGSYCQAFNGTGTVVTCP
jgi:hypothetical protein